MEVYKVLVLVRFPLQENQVSLTSISSFPYKKFAEIKTFLLNNKLPQVRIVIADDSDFILERLQKMLTQLDKVEVVGVYHNGTEALAALKKLNPDLAILDNKMPGLKGVDVIREIRKENRTVKLMLLTLYANTYYRQQAINAGADYFFSKSEDFEQIPEAIMQLRNNGNE